MYRGRPISLQPHARNTSSRSVRAKRQHSLRVAHGLLGRRDQLPLVPDVVVLGQSRQALDAAHRQLHSAEPGDSFEHLHVGDDLAGELDQQTVGRLVGWFIEPGNEVFVGGCLVGGPQAARGPAYGRPHFRGQAERRLRATPAARVGEGLWMSRPYRTPCSSAVPVETVARGPRARLPSSHRHTGRLRNRSRHV